MKTGAELILEERKRQIEVEGYDEEHDSKEPLEELLKAAVCYTKVNYEGSTIGDWPKSWDYRYWKPKDRLRNLVRAGALIAAAIDKLQNENESK